MDTSLNFVSHGSPSDVGRASGGLSSFEQIGFMTFGVSQKDIEAMGLSSTKAVVKKRFRQLMFGIHPDKHPARNWILINGNPTDIHDLIRRYRRIQALRYMPMTTENCDRVLVVQKGFKTTRHVDYGLNGPA